MADELNFQLPPQGFDSYTVGILPFDQGILAGAFSVAMQQIRNIQSVNMQQFAQVAYSMENMAGLPFTAGTDVPTDLGLATFAKSQTALGSGVYGTFTNSNFFGCMSGLPYPLKAIYEGVKQLETEKLKIIYQQLYLTTTAKQAQATIQRTLSAVAQPFPSTDYDYYFQITGITLTDRGGGYSRGGAPAPNITISGSSGATAICTINTDPNAVPGLFGKVQSLTLTSAGSLTNYDSGSDPNPPDPGLTATFECPPDQILSYPYTTGGSNGSSINWTNMNTYIVDTLVKNANDEILAIKNASASNFRAANILDTNWNITGTALKQEQRARYNFAPPVPIPYDRWLVISPVALYVFVDSIPDLAKKTLPHMAAQTLEHISNLRNTGGQSVVGLMRQERNQERLQQIGIELDNNIPDGLTEQEIKILITNGTLPGAVEGVPNPTGIDYTLPANPAVEIPVSGNPCDGNVVTTQITPNPIAIFDVNIQLLREITSKTEGNISAILDNTCLGPFGNGTGPALFGFDELPPGLPPPTDACGGEVEGNPTPCVDNNGEIPIVVVNPIVPTGGLPISDDPTSGFPVGGPTPGGPIGTPGTPGGPIGIGTQGEPTGIDGLPVVGNDPNNPIGDGINLQPPVSILPPTLNTAYTGTTLIPSTYNVPDAIDKVIECNCDCWIG